MTACRVLIARRIGRATVTPGETGVCDRVRMTDPVPAIAIRDVPERHRYELTVDGAVAGISIYRLGDGVMVFEHTEVDEAYEGRGLGSRLAKFALDDVRSRGLRIRIECPFIRSYIRRHREYDDLRVRSTER
jgi:predicted GNAT family acetyltransferase